MTFTTDRETKLAFLKGAWKSRPALLFCAAAGIAGAVGALASAPFLAEALETMAALGHIEAALERSAAASGASRPVLLFTVSCALALLGLVPLIWRRGEAGKWVRETVEVSDAELRWVARGDGTPEGMLEVVVCRLNGCSFSYDAARRQLSIRDAAGAAMASGLVASPGAAATIAFADLYSAGGDQDGGAHEMTIYPYFEPDLVRALREAGIEELRP